MNAPTGICTEDEEGGWVDDLGQEKKKRKKKYSRGAIECITFKEMGWTVISDL